MVHPDDLEDIEDKIVDIPESDEPEGSEDEYVPFQREPDIIPPLPPLEVELPMVEQEMVTPDDMDHLLLSLSNVSVTYLDTYALQLWDIEPQMRWRINTYAIPHFRKRYFLPLEGPCPLQPKFFVIRENENHFFTVYMDHEHKSVTVFGRTSRQGRDQWEDWNGPQIYHHICLLHDWTLVPPEDVNVVSIPWKMNGVDCGPIAILVGQYLLAEGSHKPHLTPCAIRRNLVITSPVSVFLILSGLGYAIPSKTTPIFATHLPTNGARWRWAPST
ncbi:hypothetical protein BJ912DRAFT_1062842 [Pholiota molesta]|nr:hypothetical protein BJ912DRAFT_1062842 [Pholiota molesta]